MSVGRKTQIFQLFVVRFVQIRFLEPLVSLLLVTTQCHDQASPWLVKKFDENDQNLELELFEIASFPTWPVLGTMKQY